MMPHPWHVFCKMQRDYIWTTCDILIVDDYMMNEQVSSSRSKLLFIWIGGRSRLARSNLADLLIDYLKLVDLRDR